MKTPHIVAGFARPQFCFRYRLMVIVVTENVIAVLNVELTDLAC